MGMVGTIVVRGGANQRKTTPRVSDEGLIRNVEIIPGGPPIGKNRFWLQGKEAKKVCGESFP